MKVFLYIILFLLIPATYFSQSRIFLDENHNDWQSVQASWTASGSSSGISLQSFKVTNDDKFLFIYFKSELVYSLQAKDGVKFYLDSDNNSSTGYSKNGIGAEIVINFGLRKGTAYRGGSQNDVSFEEMFMVTSPTVDSDWFEVSMSRNAVINSSNLFSSDNIKLIFADESAVGGASTDAISYSFQKGNLDPLPLYSFEKKSAEHLRVLSQNVEFDGFFEEANKPIFERLYNVIDPDIIGLVEIYNHSGDEAAVRLEEMLPSPQGKSWNGAQIADNIIVTRYKIKNSWSAGSFGNGVFLLDLRPDYDTDALVVVAHPPCCDNDAARQDEVDAIMAFIREAKNPGGLVTLSEGSPIIILGDMNFVGDPQQVTTLLTGDIVNENIYGSDFTPDWNGTDLMDAKPFVTELPMTFTQGIGNSPGSFSKGRLDYMLYTGSVLELQNSFVLYTNSLPQSTLANYGLWLNDSESASDHFPVVSDFQVTATNNVRTIASIRRNDSNGSPQLLNSTVTVSGIVTAAQEFGSAGPAYIQDGTAGIAVYGNNLITGLQIGDDITIISPLGFYNGLTEIIYNADNSFVTVNSSDNAVDPETVTINQVINQTWNDLEEYEGMLIKIEHATFSETGSFASNNNYTLTDGTGSITLRIDNDVDIIGTQIPTGEVSVTAIVSQYDNAAPYSTGYQLLPRKISDIEEPQSEYLLVWSDEFNSSTLDETRWTRETALSAYIGETKLLRQILLN